MLVSSRNKKSSEMAALLAEFDGAAVATSEPQFKSGEAVRGRVLSVSDEVVIVDLTAKLSGTIAVSAFEAEEKPLPAVGTEIEAYFLGLGDDDTARLAISDPAAIAVSASIQGAFAAKLPIEGEFVKEAKKGGYEVLVDGERAFCPYSQVARFRPREGAPSPVGTKTTFMVVEYEPAEHRLVVSHRAVEEKIAAEKEATLREELAEGQERDGEVVRVVDFGAFVDIGGVEGLLPASEISWDRTKKPADLLKEGDKVRVLVKRVDWDARRFSFSLKALVADPFDAYVADFDVNSFVSGTVSRIMPFGVFVKLDEGVEGLIPISRLGNGRHIVDAHEIVSEGDEVDLRIERIDREEKKIGLLLIDKRVAALKPGELAIGATAKGIVESVREFGAFVKLDLDHTGLLHFSEMDFPRGKDAPRVTQAMIEAKFPVGSDIEVVIKDMTGDRIALTLPSTIAARAAVVAEREATAAAIRGVNEAASATPFGGFGDLLDAALKGE